MKSVKSEPLGSTSQRSERPSLSATLAEGRAGSDELVASEPCAHAVVGAPLRADGLTLVRGTTIGLPAGTRSTIDLHVFGGGLSVFHVPRNRAAQDCNRLTIRSRPYLDSSTIERSIPTVLFAHGHTTFSCHAVAPLAPEGRSRSRQGHRSWYQTLPRQVGEKCCRRSGFSSISESRQGGTTRVNGIGRFAVRIEAAAGADVSPVNHFVLPLDQPLVYP